MDFSLSDKSCDYLSRVQEFIEQHIVPYESDYRKENQRLNASLTGVNGRCHPM